MPFRDRDEAGARLAAALERSGAPGDAIVLGLPPGGVPIAKAIARELHLPFDVFVVRRLAVPGHEELTMGAVASGGIRVLNDGVIMTLRVDAETIEEVTTRQRAALERRERAIRGHAADHAPLAGRTVVLVDEGIVTGATVALAVEAIRECRPRSIVIASAVASRATCAALHTIAEGVVCLETPDAFTSVSRFFLELPPLSDADVRAALESGEIAGCYPASAC